MTAYDVILKNCTVLDGSGQAPFHAHIGIRDGRIAAIASRLGAPDSQPQSRLELDCDGLIVAPGLINLHSWAATDLLADGRAMSDIMQGVTLEVFGESWSEGPLSPQMKAYIREVMHSEVPWNTLSEFPTLLEQGVGVSVNVASYVGIDNLRYYTVGQDSRPATAEELARMVSLLESEMRAGAMGVGSALIYVPGLFFQTHELRELALAAFRHGGAYISHIRSEGNQFDEALQEFLTICEDGRGILYHFKVNGQRNWGKLPAALERITQAQNAGAQIGACVYPYAAGMTSLSAVLPPWARVGGLPAILQVLSDPLQRPRLLAEMAADQDEWENLYLLSGGATGVKVLDLKSPACVAWNGLMLSEIAEKMELGPEEAILELILAEKGEPMGIFFAASEDNLRAILRKPWVCIGSDVGSIAADESSKITHPRAFGSFARFLSRYCHRFPNFESGSESGDPETTGLMSLSEGIRRVTSLPAALLGIDQTRGYLRPGYAADIIAFDPATLCDHATYQDPLRYATGIQYVLVNGQIVIDKGIHTGAKPGQFVRGPGFTP